MQRPPSWVPCAPQWTVKKTALTSHLWCRFAALASLLYVLRNYCGNKAPRSARRKEAHAPLSSSCTAIVAAWLKPLLFGRCRIHAPPPPSPTPSTLNNICKRSQASHASHQGKERGQHSPSLPFSLSLFLRLLRKMQVATVTCRVCSLSSIYLHLCTQRHGRTFLHTCTVPTFAVRMPYLP